MSRRQVLMPLPDRDFDVTEVAAADRLLLSGVVFGRLGAETEAKSFYHQLVTEDRYYASPITWDQIVPEDFARLVLPGEHAPGMRQYLGGKALHDKVAAFWELQRPVGAICHRTLVLARARDKTGRTR